MAHRPQSPPTDRCPLRHAELTRRGLHSSIEYPHAARGATWYFDGALNNQVASDAACSGDVVGKSGSGIRLPSRRKPAPVSAIVKAPPHQMAAGDVPSR